MRPICIFKVSFRSLKANLKKLCRKLVLLHLRQLEVAPIIINYIQSFFVILLTNSSI